MRNSNSSFYDYVHKVRPESISIGDVNIYFYYKVTGKREITFFPSQTYFAKYIEFDALSKSAQNTYIEQSLSVQEKYKVNPIVIKTPDELGNIVQIYINPFSEKSHRSAKDFYFEYEAKALIELWLTELKNSGLNVECN